MPRSNAQWVLCTFTSGKSAWCLRVECASGWVDWPIQYYDGRIAYDFPERVPAYIKKKVAQLYKVGPPTEKETSNANERAREA